MSSTPATDELLGTILALVDVELPEGDGQGSAPGYVIKVLRESQDFWEDEKRDLIDPIWLEYLKLGDDWPPGSPRSGADPPGCRSGRSLTALSRARPSCRFPMNCPSSRFMLMCGE